MMPNFWPRAQVRRRWLKAVRRAPLSVQALVGVIAIVAVWGAANAVYQVARKPTEMLFPVSDSLNKTPAETWRQFGPLFREHSTRVMSAELLAALAQVEGSGNPIARTYWRWSFDLRPFELYRPASSAVGMYQFTNGTFAEARRYCIHDHKVVEQGRWNDPDACWFNGLYSRVLPSDAVELAAAYLDHRVASIVTRHRLHYAALRQKQNLAAVIHLCGAGAGDGYARRGFRFLPRQRCGAHDARAYVARVNSLQAVFARLATSA